MEKPVSRESDRGIDVPAKRPGGYRVLHTADWHLGKLLNDRSRDEEHRKFLEWLLSVVREHEVDAILLAGDVFDTANPPTGAQQRYFTFVADLFRTTGCTLAVIGGNHDSAAHLDAPKYALHALNVHVFGRLEEDYRSRFLLLPTAGNPQLAVAMVPFLRERDLRVGKAGEGADVVRASIVAGIERVYRETAAAVPTIDAFECPVIATGHLTVVGARSSDSERDIHIGGLGAVSSAVFPEQFSYVALGHLHRPQATDDAGRVRYAGSPIPLSFSESSDTKEVRVLDAFPDRIEQFSLPVPLFRRLAQIRTSADHLEKTLLRFDPETRELPTWVEVVVEGETLSTDLNERVRKATGDRDFAVLKVVRERSASRSVEDPDTLNDDEALDTLLDRPDEVFDRLLRDYPGVDTQQGDRLRIAFRQLLERTG